MVTERQLKIAYILGHFSSVWIRTTRSKFGVPSLAFPLKEIRETTNEILEKADPQGLKEISDDEIREVLKLLGMEEYIIEE